MDNILINKVKGALRFALELPENQEIPNDAHLKNDLGIDSLSSMDFLVKLEDEIEGFVVNANTLEARHFNTTETMVAYIEAELVANGYLEKTI